MLSTAGVPFVAIASWDFAPSVVCNNDRPTDPRGLPTSRHAPVFSLPSPSANSRVPLSYTVQRIAMQGGSRPSSASNRPITSPAPRVQYQVNTQTKVLDSVHGRILCIADIRGRLSALNDMARDANAVAVIHTGDFGFFGL